MNDEEDFEREFNKLKLSAEHGIPFSEKKREEYHSESDLEFLEKMREMEEAMANPDVTTINELLGSINFPKGDNLTDAEISAALDLATTALANNNIQLDIIYPTPDREIYRFITEELMEQGSGAAGLGGMTMHYIYEEFYPNYVEDIKADVTDTLHFISGGHKGKLPWRIDDKVKLHGKMVPQEEFEQLLITHRDVFQGMNFVSIDSMDVDINKTKAHVKASFRVYMDQSSRAPGEVNIAAEFDFKFSIGIYVITRLVIDKFGIK